jgi:hypothetical protein
MYAHVHAIVPSKIEKPLTGRKSDLLTKHDESQGDGRCNLLKQTRQYQPSSQTCAGEGPDKKNREEVSAPGR